jgi:hypothetical protein
MCIEGERVEKSAFRLSVIPLRVATNQPAFITPPQVNARPIHAFLPRCVVVGCSEVLKNANSHGAARQRDVCTFPLRENIYKQKTGIAGNTLNDTFFVVTNDECARDHGLVPRHESEPVGHDVAIDDIRVQTAQFLGKTIAQRSPTERDIVGGLTRLLESRHLLVSSCEDDVSVRASQRNAMNRTVIRDVVGQLNRDGYAQSQREPCRQQPTTRGVGRHRHRYTGDGIMRRLVEYGR